MVLVALAPAVYLLDASGSVTTEGSIVQTVHGRVPHPKQPSEERGMEQAANCQSTGV